MARQRRRASPGFHVCGVHPLWPLLAAAVVLSCIFFSRVSTGHELRVTAGRYQLSIRGPAGASEGSPGRAGEVERPKEDEESAADRTAPPRVAPGDGRQVPSVPPAEIDVPGRPAAKGGNEPEKKVGVETGVLPSYMTTGTSEALQLDWKAALQSAFSGPSVPLTLPAPAALDLHSGILSLLRVQKTASKTVQAILMWMAADAVGGSKRKTRNACACSYFSTSDVPVAAEVEAVYQAADAEGKLALAASPFKDSLGEPVVGKRPWPAELGSRWYKGAQLPGRPERACANFDPPALATKHTHCPFIHAQHLHMGDLEGAVASLRGKGGEAHQIVAVVRHPLRRVLSEFKHVANNGPGLWDYCHNVTVTQRLRTGWQTKDRARGVLADFLAVDAHAFGMRNRQAKMLSGLVTEPPRPLPQATWEGYTAGGADSDGLAPPGAVQSPGQPDQAYVAWAADALALARWRLSTAGAVLVSERLAESLAVMMVRYKWLPLVSDVTPETPRGPIVEDPEADALRALERMRDETPDQFKRDERHRYTLGLERAGRHFDYSVHVDFSSCPDRLKAAAAAAGTWPAAWGEEGYEAPEEAPAPPGQGEVPSDLAGLPEVKAKLTSWGVLVCLGSAMAEDMRGMDVSDKRKLPFEAEGKLKDRLLSLNELDVAVHAHALRLLETRVQAAKRFLADDPGWLPGALEFGNDPAPPIRPQDE